MKLPRHVRTKYDAALGFPALLRNAQRGIFDWYWPEAHFRKDACSVKRVFVDRTDTQRETLGDLVGLFLKEVSDKRPGKASCTAERARLERFKREEKFLRSYAVAHFRLPATTQSAKLMTQ